MDSREEMLFLMAERCRKDLATLKRRLVDLTGTVKANLQE